MSASRDTESFRTPTATPLLRLENISKTFGGVRALIDVDFEVAPGEVHCLAGENGCGKSTLIKIISGVYEMEPGAHVAFDGEVMDSLSPTLARNLGIQVIWQDLALFNELSVAENIAFEQNLGVAPSWVRRERMRDTAREVLDRLGFKLDVDRRVSDLPIADRQLVAICRSLVAEARIIFMDEPTSSLTRAETNSLLEIVRRLSAEGIAVVFVSHRLAEVLAICQRVTVLRDGRKVGVYPGTGMTQSRLAMLMTGKTFDDPVHAHDRSGSPPVLEIRNLTRFGEFEDVSLSVRRGEIVGITGLLGAGRTELALSVFGMAKSDRGTILVDGKPVRLRSNQDAIREGIAYLSEDRLQLGLIQEQSISGNIAITVLDRILGATGLIEPKKESSLARHWIEQLSVRIGRPQDAVSTLSGGNQQRIVIAKWLATEPKVLILDSPTVGVDIGARVGIFEIVRKLAAEGMAILVLSDEIPEVFFNTDRILHMKNGRIVSEYFPPESSIDRIEGDVHA